MDDPKKDFVSLTPDKYCLECNYPLIGLDRNRCPECGKDFNPDDANTYKKTLDAKWRWETFAAYPCLMLSIAYGIFRFNWIYHSEYSYALGFVFLAFSIGLSFCGIRRGCLNNRFIAAFALTIATLYALRVLYALLDALTYKLN